MFPVGLCAQLAGTKTASRAKARPTRAAFANPTYLDNVLMARKPPSASRYGSAGAAPKRRCSPSAPPMGSPAHCQGHASAQACLRGGQQRAGSEAGFTPAERAGGLGGAALAPPSSHDEDADGIVVAVKTEIELRHLRVFAAVVDAGSYTRAARAL